MTREQVLKRLGLQAAAPDRNHHVPCPLHKSRSATLSVHPGKGVFQCFSCGAKGNLAKLFDGAPDAPEEVPCNEVRLENIVSPADVRAAAKTFKAERRLGSVKGLDVDVTPGSRTFGYLEIPDAHGRVAARRRLFPGEPRYLYEAGGPGGVCCVQAPQARPGTPVWVVEGALDAWALRLAGAQGGVYALGTSDLPAALAYALQDYHVLLALDNDVAGYMGAKRALEECKGTDTPATRVRLRAWKDPGEAWATSGAALGAWVRRHEERLAPDERAYVASLLKGKEPLLVLPSGVPAVDRAVEYAPGLHTLQGMTTVGKSSWAIWVAVQAALEGRHVVYVTTELTKRQVWARIASVLSGAPSWVRLEKNLALLKPAAQKQLGILSERVRVLGNRGPRQIENDARAHGAHLVVVDYLQRLHGTVVDGDGVTAASLGAVTGELGDLAQEREIVVLAISSINRAGYGDGGSLGSAKGSGDIEYFSQSLTSMVRVPGGEKVTFRVEKNTRGEVGACVEAAYWPLNCRFGGAR